MSESEAHNYRTRILETLLRHVNMSMLINALLSYILNDEKQPVKTGIQTIFTHLRVNFLI